MTHNSQPEQIRTHAGASADVDDSRVWRWYAGLMEGRRVVYAREDTVWTVVIDGRLLAYDPSFDSAVRTAYVLHRARSALGAVRAN